ncbi:MAG: hypothetical protein CMD65_03925 [Gammaproteobacteria bacterium]|nr:hypothetical protein [Gammaproteobacteria bacterium]|tara:strand:+ start:8883 stop:9380 length:498 start_codon:yes stop_codon:yes gene_type:complete
MNNIFKVFVFSLTSLILISCGYTIRGSLNLPNNIDQITLHSQEYSDVSNDINLLLTSMNIKTATKSRDDDYAIHIINERLDKRQLTINPDGRVNEYELIFTVTFAIKTPSKQFMPDTITLYRDYSFDESKILGTSDRESTLHDEMIATASTIIIDRFKAKIINNP